MKSAVFSPEGLPLGFYDQATHGNSIPAEAVEITEAQWREFINHQGQRRWQDGQVVLYEPPGPSDEKKWVRIRLQRDRLLLASDWTQLPDSPLPPEKKQVWSSYRQALRDLSKTFPRPDEVSWPKKPR